MTPDELDAALADLAADAAVVDEAGLIAHLAVLLVKRNLLEIPEGSASDS